MGVIFRVKTQHSLLFHKVDNNRNRRAVRPHIVGHAADHEHLVFRNRVNTKLRVIEKVLIEKDLFTISNIGPHHEVEDEFVFRKPHMRFAIFLKTNLGLP